MEKVNLAEKLASFTDHWRPRILAEINGQHVKVVKFIGPFTCVVSHAPPPPVRHDLPPP